MFKLVLVWTLILLLAWPGTSAQGIKIGVSLSFQGDDAEWSVAVTEVMNLRLQQLLDPAADYPVVADLRVPGAIQIAASAIGSAIHLAQTLNANALIGVGYSEPTTAFASAARTFGLPVCDGASTSPSLSAKGAYPNFFRFLPNDNMAGEPIVGLVHAQGYRQVGVVYSVDSYGVGLSNSVRDYAERYGVALLTSQTYIPGTGDFKPVMDQIEASGATIILFLGTHNDLLSILAEASTRGMVGAGYQWITGDDALYTDVNKITPVERHLLHGVWASYPKEGTGVAWDAFLTDWRKTHDFDPYSYSLFFASCIESFVWSYDHALRHGNGTTLAALASNTVRLATPHDVSFPDRLGVTGPNWTGIDVKEFHQYTTPVYFSGAVEKPADALEIYKEYRTVAWGSGLGVFVVIVCALSVLAVGAVAAYVLANQRSSVFKPLSPSFLLTTLLGTAIASFYPLTLLGTPTITSCTASVWILPAALGLVLGSLLVKTYRLFRIFRSQGFATKSMQNSRMFVLLAVCFAVYMMLAVVWTAVDAPKPQWHLQQKVSRTHHIFEYYCRSDSETLQWVFLGLTFAYTIGLLIYGGFLCWVSRNLPKKFRESKPIGTLLYTYIGIFIALIVILFVLDLNTSGLSALKTIATGGVVGCTLGVLFIKNCYLAWAEKQKEKSAPLLVSGVGGTSEIRGKGKGKETSSVGGGGDQGNSNLAVKAGSRHATKVGAVFVASKQSFMTVWLPKQLILYGDKGFALIVNSSDSDPTLNSNMPTCHFIMLSEFTSSIQALETKQLYCLKLAHKKGKTANFMIRVESEQELDDWTARLAKECRSAVNGTNTIGAGAIATTQRVAAIMESATGTSNGMDKV
ncbi:periplasmic binding protein-like I [Fimicolochytrium jonesii]|uniref:periplasmic binding protein-like I n=1 Tax=Fimicolochytrium jonesii TaxID=1396493 RepID=UPI0022FF1503|nr:periplasmic binding protein-like I [Fimicolochytrium jonesii]KAI8817498.1 periplasmic binding protein-like I [Fimicolochytrium jonesii]